MLVEWHLTPEYINRHWTEEMLALMLRSRLKRIRRMNAAVRPDGKQSDFLPIGKLKDSPIKKAQDAVQFGGGIRARTVKAKAPAGK